MKKYFYNKVNTFGLLLFLFIGSCDTLETDLTEDNTTLNPNTAQLNYFFNQVQLGYNSFFNSMQFTGAQVTRIEVMRNTTYEGHLFPSTFNGAWQTGYMSVLMNNKIAMEKVAELEAQGNNMDRYKVVSKILEASTWVMLADYFNDIPFSEALQGSANFNPKRDRAQDIYASAYQMLDDAITLIDANRPNPAPLDDIYYNSNMANWKRLANSLKLQMTINSRIVDVNATAKFNTILTDDFYLNNSNQDFQFFYNTTSSNPDSRHPIYRNQYQSEATTYLSGDFIDYMAGDPREAYYFYKQTPNGNNFTRRHGSTLPNVGTDFNAMTVHGVYPYGGTANGASTGATNPTMGLAGAGFNEFISHYATQFLIAEGQLMLNNNPAAAKLALENAVRAHFEKVRVFGQTVVPESNRITPALVNTYIANLMANYDSATDKLEVIMRESYKASWGNGVKAYNNYRRTGKPSNLATLNVPSNDTFAYRMPYPTNYTTNNLNPDNVFTPISQRAWWADASINLNF